MNDEQARIERWEARARQKQQLIRSLERQLDDLDDEAEKKLVRAELDILVEENVFQKKRLEKWRSEYANLKLDYLKKRRDAIVAGEME